jgi:hypothetical protein
MNLYNTDNGTKSFGGVIHTENKGTMMLFDEWNRSIHQCTNIKH